MNVDLGKVITLVGEQAITEMGEPLGLDKELSLRAAKALANNFTGDKDAAIKAAAAETGLGKDVLEAMLTKLVDVAKDKAVDAVKDQATSAAKNLFGKFFGR